MTEAANLLRIGRSTAYRKDPHEKEPVFPDFDNFGDTGLGVFVAYDDRVAQLLCESRSKVADVRGGQSAVVTSLEVDP